MKEAQKRKRNLGKGMRPRVTENKEVAVNGGPVSENDVYPDEAQHQKQGIVEVADNKEDVTSAENPDFFGQPPRNVDPSNEVAVTDGFGEAPEPSMPTLEELMKLSRDLGEVGIYAGEQDPTTDASVFPLKSFTPRPNPSPGMIAIPTPEEIATLTKLVPDELEWPERETQVVATLGQPLGPQPNGDYAAVVMIREGYWPLVEQQAASDGITPSEWLSQHLMEYLEAYATPPRNA